MHRLSTSFVLGYHGCEAAVAEKLLAGEPFKASSNDYDWLGPGIYFWEANPRRRLDFAVEAMARRKSDDEPAVVGAVIDLGLCLDMTTTAAILRMKEAYASLRDTFEAAGEALPTNGRSLLLRRLDCAVVQRLHTILDADGVVIDTVRGIFPEGGPIYPDSGFSEKTHIQIAVRDRRCIKGVFRVPQDQLR